LDSLSPRGGDYAVAMTSTTCPRRWRYAGYRVGLVT
jgi:hypothetical protein